MNRNFYPAQFREVDKLGKDGFPYKGLEISKIEKAQLSEINFYKVHREFIIQEELGDLV